MVTHSSPLWSPSFHPRRSSVRARSLLVAASAFLFLPLASCLGGADAGSASSASSAGGVAQATAGSGSVAAQNPLGGHGSTGAGGFNQQTIPIVSYPEDRWIRLEREIWFLDLDGTQRGVRDQLLSDGNGNVRLDLLQVWDDASGAWVAPDAAEVTNYLRESDWNVRHRELHLGREVALQSNYTWSSIGGISVAGRSTSGTLAENRYGMGDVALYHDDNDGGLLLAWSITDPTTGQTLVSLTTTVIELQPDLNGVSWPQDASQLVPYDAQQHIPLLGIRPVPPSYLPPGSYIEGTWLSTPVIAGAPSQYAHVQVCSDGLRSLLIVQYRDDTLGGTNLTLPVGIAVRLLEDWEVVVKGNRDVRVFSTQGTFPELDMELVAAGLVE